MMSPGVTRPVLAPLRSHLSALRPLSAIIPRRGFCFAFMQPDDEHELAPNCAGRASNDFVRGRSRLRRRRAFKPSTSRSGPRLSSPITSDTPEAEHLRSGAIRKACHAADGFPRELALIGARARSIDKRHVFDALVGRLPRPATR